MSKRNPTVVVTQIGIVYHTSLQYAPSHTRGRIGPPLVIQEKYMPEELALQIRELVQKFAEEYWGDVEK